MQILKVNERLHKPSFKQKLNYLLLFKVDVKIVHSSQACIFLYKVNL
jgi:hypothetical protein